MGLNPQQRHNDMTTYYITEMYPNGRISPPYAIDRDDINAASYYAEQNRLISDSTLIVEDLRTEQWISRDGGTWQELNGERIA